jgi:hypothetical protein
MLDIAKSRRRTDALQALALSPNYFPTVDSTIEHLMSHCCLAAMKFKQWLLFCNIPRGLHPQRPPLSFEPFSLYV